MKKKYYTFILLATVICLGCLFLLSCTKPDRDNPFDPMSNYTTPMQDSLALTQITDSQVKLEWQLNPTIVGNYIIKRQVNSGDYEVLSTIDKETNTYTDTGLMTTNTYHYQLIGANGDVQTEPLTNSISTTFAGITNFSIQQETVLSAKLTWDHNCSYEEGYILERREISSRKNPISKKRTELPFGRGDVRQLLDRGVNNNEKKMKIDNDVSRDFIQIADLSTNTLEYVDETLIPNHSYEYRMHAYTELNNSTEMVETFDNTFPAPSNLQINQDNVHTFSLVWDDNSEGENGFTIERKIDNGDYLQIGTNTSNDTIFVDDINSENQFGIVYYKITAFYQTSFSDSLAGNYSIEFPAPTNLTYNQLTIISIELTWDDNSINEDGFKIDKKVGSNNWQEEFAIISENTEEWTDTNAEINEDIQYRVYAYSGSNQSNSIETGVIDNTFPAPENLEFSIENISYPTVDIHLEWDYAASGIEGFKVLKNGILLSNIILPEVTEWIDVSLNVGDIVSYQVLAFYQSYNSAYSNEVICGVAPEGMIFVQGGTFEMGDHYNEGNSDELPIHEVTLDDFFIGEFEVTQAEFVAIYGSNPGSGYGDGDDYPVYNVTWNEAATYCNLKSQQEGLTPCYNLSSWSCDYEANGYRLPTEAEWEYAARGGLNWEDNYRFSGISTVLNYVAWYGTNSGSQSHEVGTKADNQLDIHDMSGNVWEWCNDWYSSEAINPPSYYQTCYDQGTVNNPTGPVSGNDRVARGGGWYSYDSECRVAVRFHSAPNITNHNIGFRLVRTH